MSAEAIIYYSSTPSNTITDNNQRQLFQLLDAHKIAYTLLDCADAANKDLRNAAWAISGKRAICALQKGRQCARSAPSLHPHPYPHHPQTRNCFQRRRMAR